MTLSEKQEQMCSESKWDFSDLKAMFLNCTLKKSPELSHTQGLIDISTAIMEKNGVTTECLRPVDFNVATGVWPEMTVKFLCLDFLADLGQFDIDQVTERCLRVIRNADSYAAVVFAT